MSRLYLLAALSVALALGSLHAQDKKPQTIKVWGTVVDPDGDCRVTEDNGKKRLAFDATKQAGELVAAIP